MRSGLFPVPPFVRYGGKIVKAGVVAVWVVPALDELENRDLGFGLILEPASIEKLALEGPEEALAHRVIVGVAGGARPGTNPGLAAASPEGE